MLHTYFRKYVGVSEEIQRQIDIRYRQYMQAKKKERILGVFLRGTDYVSVKPYEHSRQPSVEEAIQKSKEVIQSQNCK